MVDYKNDGVAGNVLSDYDFGSVLKDAHNKSLNALDVNVINGLVPEKFHRIALEYKDMGDDTFEVEYIKYYAQGTKEITNVDIREYPQGKAEITTFSFLSQTPAGLDGKYLIIYDDVGSVGVWFDLDNGSTPPTTGAARDIEVDIATGDSATNIATKLSAALDSDSKFIGVSVLTASVIQSSTVGNKTDATAGTTTIGIEVTTGYDTLNSKYFLMFSGEDRTEYYVWYDIDSGGSDPSLVGKTGIEVNLTSSDSQSTVATKTASSITSVDDFTATADGNTTTITNSYYGATSDIADGDSGFTFTPMTQGVSGTLVATIRVFFDSNNLITSVERIA